MVIHGTKEGLGIRIVGGNTATTEDFGIFVKEVLRGTLASRDGETVSASDCSTILYHMYNTLHAGQLQRGDQLIQANGTSLVGVSNELYVHLPSSIARLYC